VTSEGRTCCVPRSEERDCRVGLEGPACQVRGATLDDPLRFGGHDKRAPPTFLSEGPACQVRGATLDDPLRFGGHDRRTPPTFLSEGPACQVRGATLDDPLRFGGHDKRAPPTCSPASHLPIQHPCRRGKQGSFATCRLPLWQMVPRCELDWDAKLFSVSPSPTVIIRSETPMLIPLKLGDCEPFRAAIRLGAEIATN
jgi:hypothetical protein